MRGTSAVRGLHWRRWLLGSLAAPALVGCTREHYRENADRAAQQVISSQPCDPRWQLHDLGIYPDARSRFFDPTCPDRPPAPEDDPTANQFMQCVYGIPGYQKWYKDGVRSDPQNPGWLDRLGEYAKFDSDGRVVLDLDAVVTLARLHNPDYQRNLEEIYLAALDVAFERFQFDVQYTGGNTTGIRTRGNLASTNIGQTSAQSRGESSTVVSTESTLEANRQFAAGAQLLVGFANSFVWQLAGPNTDYAASLVNFSLVQPLLRNAGKAVVLEQLTRAERSLLAALRSQAQFRQDFHRFLVVGGNPVSVNPRRIGGFQGGAGLSGFTGTGQGGFGGVGEGQNFGNTGAQRNAGTGGGGAAGFAGGGENNVGGFYGLAQRIQAIRNTQTNLNNQLLTLGLLESLADAGLIDSVQVDEFRQNVETERANLLRVQVGLQDTLEFYLLDSLGVPPTLRVAIDDSVLKAFQFLDPKQLEHQSFANAALRKAGALPTTPSMDQVKDLQKDLGTLLDDAIADVEAIRKELDGAKDKLKTRLEDIDDERERASYRRDLDNMKTGLDGVAKSLENDRARRDKLLRETEPGKEKAVLARTVELLRTLAGRLQEAGLYQARIRLEQVTVPKVDLDFPTAFLVARLNRLDWMNNRAAFVDQWRLITLNANRLEAFLNLQLDGDVGTHGDNLLRFNGATGTLRARLIFDAPLNRVAERNLYRESLISYQRARRNYINYVDNVAFGLRGRLRDLQRLRENLEIQRQALVIAIRRVDRTLQELNAPFSPPAPGQAASQLSPVLATNLLRALSDFRSTQDNFTSVYFAYESSRINLMFQLGTMQIDDSGKWIDEPLEQAIARALGEMREECRTGDGPIVTAEELQYLGVDASNASPALREALAAGAQADGGPRAPAQKQLKVVADAVSPLPKEETPQTAPAAPAGATPAGILADWWKSKRNQSALKRYSDDGKSLSPAGRAKFMQELREIHSMHRQGAAAEEIAQAKRLDVRAVKGLLAARSAVESAAGAPTSPERTPPAAP
jgi:hypothetical protein